AATKQLRFFRGSRATRCVVSRVGAVRRDSRLIFSFMSTMQPLPVSGPMCCAFNAPTAEPNMRLRCSGLPRSHSRSSPARHEASALRGDRWHKVGDPRGGAGEALPSARCPGAVGAREIPRCPSRFGVIVMQRFGPILILDGPTPGQPAPPEEGSGMSSYASYCQEQAAECARQARLASSPEIVAYRRSLEVRWLMLATQVRHKRLV